MEDYIKENCELDMPPVEGLDTIFEYMVNEEGKWQHWSERVRLECEGEAWGRG